MLGELRTRGKEDLGQGECRDISLYGKSVAERRDRDADGSTHRVTPHLATYRNQPGPRSRPHTQARSASAPFKFS